MCERRHAGSCSSHNSHVHTFAPRSVSATASRLSIVVDGRWPPTAVAMSTRGPRRAAPGLAPFIARRAQNRSPVRLIEVGLDGPGHALSARGEASGACRRHADFIGNEHDVAQRPSTRPDRVGEADRSCALNVRVRPCGEKRRTHRASGSHTACRIPSLISQNTMRPRRRRSSAAAPRNTSSSAPSTSHFMSRTRRGARGRVETIDRQRRNTHLSSRSAVALMCVLPVSRWPSASFHTMSTSGRVCPKRRRRSP